MGYAAYDKVGGEARDGRWLPFSDVDDAGAESEAPTMPCAASSKAPVGDGPPSLAWCVERGASLEAMSTAALWRALDAGILPPETRVWREGLECWTPASQVRELRWTVARLSTPPGAAEDRGEGAVVSAGLTPAELGVVQQWAAAAAPRVPEPPPGSSREERSELPTLMSTPEPSDPDQLSPISLELPTSFPGAPVSQEAAGAEGPPCQAPARVEEPLNLEPSPSGTRPRFSQRLAEGLARRRDALFVAAGFAVAALSIGAALAEADAPRPARLVARLATVEGAVDPELAAPPPAVRGSAATTPAGQRLGERGQQRLRRGAAHGSSSARTDATSAQRAESR
jgi:hypothetical protein